MSSPAVCHALAGSCVGLMQRRMYQGTTLVVPRGLTGVMSDAYAGVETQKVYGSARFGTAESRALIQTPKHQHNHISGKSTNSRQTTLFA